MVFTSKHVFFCITTGLCAIIATSYILIGRNKYISIDENTKESAGGPLFISQFQDSKRNKNKIGQCKLLSRSSTRTTFTGYQDTLYLDNLMQMFSSRNVCNPDDVLVMLPRNMFSLMLSFPTEQLEIHSSDFHQTCQGNVPNYIIQYGPARTATTLQFNILCLCMAMLHEDEKKSVGCYFEKDIPVSRKYTVIKTHTIAKFLTAAIPSDSWIFMTRSDALSPWKKLQLKLSIRKIKEHNITIPYVADVSLVSKRGYFIAYEYQSIFWLSDVKMQHIVEYLRYWDILRLCCGKQMSQDWRNKLSPNPNYKRHHDPHGLSYPSCEMYNISKVEKNLLNTYVFNIFKDTFSLRNFIGKPSIVDGNLDGNYCARCNAYIAQRHLKFNDRCA